MALLIATFLLTAFALLAVIDGFYLHIFKYQLHGHAESRLEHLTHTARAILFPAIVYFLFILQNCAACFYLGLGLVLLDIGVLAIDAFVEKDSRAFMGGLPRWEYILHLFVNGFHFASIAVFLAVKIDLSELGMVIHPDLSGLKHFSTFQWVAQNLLPGALLLAAIHIMTGWGQTRGYWDRWRAKVTCC